MEDKNRLELEAKAKEIRKMTLDAIGHLGVGHVGGAMSIVDALTVLYHRHMTVDAQHPRNPDRDKLVLSKGHAGPALYSVLADLGFFPRPWLHTLNAGGTHLPSHCDMNRTPGVDMTTGSLGQGLSAAIGLALANRLDGSDRYVYCVIGDGESDEGQVWEAAMAAAQYRLDRLIALTDYNKMQIDGLTRDVMGLDDLSAKWTAFGWHVQRVDGHDVVALDHAIGQARETEGRPSMIVMDTIKGKGALFAEGKVGSHNMPVDKESALEAIRALG